MFASVGRSNVKPIPVLAVAAPSGLASPTLLTHTPASGSWLNSCESILAGAGGPTSTMPLAGSALAGGAYGPGAADEPLGPMGVAAGVPNVNVASACIPGAKLPVTFA